MLPYVDHLSKYWDYFESQWCRHSDPNIWNVSALVGKMDDRNKQLLVNRTDNPLERHNRDMKMDFPSAHPSLMDFVYAIRDKSNGYVADIEAHRLQQKRGLDDNFVDRHKDAVASLFQIPPAFYTFVP